MSLSDAFTQHRVEGFETPHDHVIETVLSKLFVRGDTVVKAYKHREADFADLTHQETRRKYVSEDFFWNQQMSPAVYLELRPVRKKENQFVHVADEHAEDWYQVMKRVDTRRDLHRMLTQELLTREDLRSYIETLMLRLQELHFAHAPSLEHILARGNQHVRDEVLGTLDWASTAVDYLSSEDIARLRKVLEGIIDTSSYFAQEIQLSVVVDVNGENILFLPEGVSFIDVMPPKDTWRIHDPYFLVARTSADVTALGSRELANELHVAYSALRELPPKEIRLLYEMTALLIQVPYRIMIGEHDRALCYATLLRSYMREGEEFLNFVDESDNTQTSQ